ncbi:response regulator [Achromobacter insolitus]|uniref:response regulator n=1 Tax=Achromobacter insolitus TaxID=217204 RepID=UPI00174B8C87|nr:response regulator [Achromobacter insolitus]
MPPQPHTPCKPTAVLVVEDDETARWLLAELLNQAGYLVSQAGNADEAVQCLRDNADVRAIITDIEMPGSTNGFEMALQVKAERPHLVVLITSGRRHPGAHQLPIGMVFRLKPWAPDDMLAILASLLLGSLGES